MACFGFISLGQVQTPDYTLNFTSMGFYYEGEATAGGFSGCMLHSWYFFILNILCIVMPLLDIFLFHNLPLQKRVCLISLLFIIADIAVAAAYGYFSLEGYTVSWSTNAMTSIIALVAAIMAYNCMQRDYKKLRSIDRIR